MESTLNLVIRKYTDVNGLPRRLVRVGPGNVIKWMKGEPHSFTTLWREEGGTIIQIPDNAWEKLNVKYIDSTETYDGNNL